MLQEIGAFFMECTMDKDNRSAIADFVEIKDISIAAYLYASNKVKLVGKRQNSSGAVLLQFSPKEKVDELVNQYWNFQAPVIQPKLLLTAFRDIKNIIYGGNT